MWNTIPLINRCAVHKESIEREGKEILLPAVHFSPGFDQVPCLLVMSFRGKSLQPLSLSLDQQ